jgi:hypothetical protein
MESERTIDIGSEELAEVHREYFDPTSPESVSVCVISAIADALGRDPTELPPVREVIDLDHLDGLFTYGYERSAPSETFVRFPYLDLVVAVWGDGQISVYERE